MSLLINTVSKQKLLDACRCLSAIQARKGHWYPYFKPGPYPKTKEEREAAAKKYNMLPEEYEPYPEDHLYPIGDYPKLPYESVDSKDPWYPWENEQLRRGFNEPVHCDQIVLLPEILSTDKPLIEDVKGMGIFFTFLLTVYGFIQFLSLFDFVDPVTEKQYPAPGVTHYTFELDYGKH